MKRIIIGIGLLTGALGGCTQDDWNNVPVCTPKKVEACVCDTGAQGQHTCEDNGRGYDACVCLDAGVGSGSGSGSGSAR